MSSQALNMGYASVSELRKRRIMRQRKEKALHPQPALLSIDIPSAVKDAPVPLELQIRKSRENGIRKFLKENFVGIVINYVGDREGDFCYCPDCENFILIKENYCPICDDGEELTLEFACEADTELSERIDFMRTTANELRENGWVVIDVGAEITLNGVPCVITHAELERDWRSWRTWIWVKRKISGMSVKYPLEFVADYFSNFSRKKS